jgi:hypothetical protein
MRKVYYHEDDYCQLELVAEANRQWCAEQMGQIDEFAAAHKADVGWTDVYARPDNPTPLATLNLSRTAFTEAMPASMLPFDRVFTGYSTYRSECKGTIAFGPHDSLVAYVELADDDVVSCVWFTFDLKLPADVTIATELARSLSRWPVMIADWGWSKLLRLTDAAALRDYYDERLKVFGRAQA